MVLLWIVVKEQNSWIAGFGIKEVPAQLIFLAFASGIVWSGESSFEYLYSILWRNLAQLSQHKLRIKAYEHIQELDMDFFENDNTGRLLSILNDCLLYTSPSPRDRIRSRMPSSA